jgi:hypothetical protein
MKTNLKTNLLRTLALAAALAFPVIGAACSHEVAHSESDKPGWFGGTKHEETTVYKNPDGTTTTEHEKSTQNP